MIMIMVSWLFCFILFMILLLLKLFLQINKLVIVVFLVFLSISKHSFNKTTKWTIPLRMHIKYFIFQQIKVSNLHGLHSNMSESPLGNIDSWCRYTNSMEHENYLMRQVQQWTWFCAKYRSDIDQLPSEQDHLVYYNWQIAKTVRARLSQFMRLCHYWWAWRP